MAGTGEQVRTGVGKLPAYGVQVSGGQDTVATAPDRESGHRPGGQGTEHGVAPFRSHAPPGGECAARLLECPGRAGAAGHLQGMPDPVFRHERGVAEERPDGAPGAVGTGLQLGDRGLKTVGVD
jgi:hypothetical protein